MLPLIADPQGQFLENYNRRNFMFAHELKGNPLFELPSLVELSLRMPDHRDTYWSNGAVAVGNTWDKGTDGRRSLQDTISNIAHNNSIVILKHTEQDPIYGPVLQTVLNVMIELSGERMRRDVHIGEVLILVSSPGRITPYHMDSEVNFLLQVSGDKTFYVFDQNDRALVPDVELESFYGVGANKAVYRPEKQNEASAYDLRAGFGIHVPVTAPHWVQNGNNVSVALSVNYELRSVARLARLYQFNHKLRRFGLSPTAPTLSPWKDQVKLAAAGGVRSLRSLMQPRPAAAHSYAAWTPPAAR